MNNKDVITDIIKSFPGKVFYDIMDLEFLESPTDFFTLLESLLTSSKNVFISTLTLGVDSKCKVLLEILKWRKQTNRATTIIVDKHRVCRNKEFVDLLYLYGIDDIFVLYDTKVFRLFPKLIQEMFSVLHSKIYIFDDTVMLTGANLDGSYFTDRLDRYIVFKSQKVSQYLIGEYFMNLKGSDKINPYALSDYIVKDAKGTYIMKFEREDEIDILTNLLKITFNKLYISTAYLNFSDEHLRLIIDRDLTIITSSPNTNTFRYNDKFEKYVVESYTLCTIRMLEQLHKTTFYEYANEDFSFHCKGFWGFGEGFVCSIIGSTNFNMRSIFRDIESNFLIITGDDKTIKAFGNEIENILKDSRTVQIEELKGRHVTTLSRYGQSIARGYL